MIFLKEFFEKYDFEKIRRRQKKNMQNSPEGKELKGLVFPEHHGELHADGEVNVTTLPVETSKKGLKLIGLKENVRKARLEIESKLTEIEVTPLFHFSHIYFFLFILEPICCVGARHFYAYFGKQMKCCKFLAENWTCWILQDGHF